MSDDRRWAAGPAALCALGILLGGCAPAPRDEPPRPSPASVDSGEEHLAWMEGPFDEVRAMADDADQPLLVDVYATWCAPCKALEAQVWESPEGRDLTRGHLLWKVDFDTEEGQAFKRRYRILGLPTVLFLQPDGTEIDRVEGFAGKEEFLIEAGPYAKGESRLDSARAAYGADPEDAATQLALGHLLLVRGEETEGTALLEAAARHGGEAGAEALFLMGRYWTRAAEEPLRAIPYWRRLHLEGGESPYAAGALYWLLKSHDEAGQLEQALDRILEGPLLRDAEDWETAVAYLASAGYEEEARQLAQAGVRRHPDSEALAEAVAAQGG